MDPDTVGLTESDQIVSAATDTLRKARARLKTNNLTNTTGGHLAAA